MVSSSNPGRGRPRARGPVGSGSEDELVAKLIQVILTGGEGDLEQARRELRRRRTIQDVPGVKGLDRLDEILSGMDRPIDTSAPAAPAPTPPAPAAKAATRDPIVTTREHTCDGCESIVRVKVRASMVESAFSGDGTYQIPCPGATRKGCQRMITLRFFLHIE